MLRAEMLPSVGKGLTLPPEASGLSANNSKMIATPFSVLACQRQDCFSPFSFWITAHSRARNARVIEHQPSSDHQAPEIMRDPDLIEPIHHDGSGPHP